MPARRLGAEWVYPVTVPPIPSGAVLIGEDGRIVAVGPDGEVPSPPGVPVEHFPGAVLMPGLVNAHSHLELTGFAGDVAEPQFDAWIRSVRSLKETRSAEDFRIAARKGVQQCFAAGITTVAETGDSGAVVEALDELGGRGVVFQEVFGPHPDQCQDSIALLAGRVAMLQTSASGRLRIGVSPHAPYTVSGPLYRAVAELARNEGLAMAVHIAESQAESDFVATGTGPFQQAWRKRGIPLPKPLGDSPIAWLERHGVLGCCAFTASGSTRPTSICWPDASAPLPTVRYPTGVTATVMPRCGRCSMPASPLAWGRTRRSRRLQRTCWRRHA